MSDDPATPAPPDRPSITELERRMEAEGGEVVRIEPDGTVVRARPEVRELSDVLDDAPPDEPRGEELDEFAFLVKCLRGRASVAVADSRNVDQLRWRQAADGLERLLRERSDARTDRDNWKRAIESLSLAYGIQPAGDRPDTRATQIQQALDSRMERMERERNEARGEVERLKVLEPPELAQHQPCGCQVCICEGTERCFGCGAENCGKPDCVLKVQGRPDAVYVDGSTTRGEILRLQAHLDRLVERLKQLIQQAEPAAVRFEALSTGQPDYLLPNSSLAEGLRGSIDAANTALREYEAERG